MNVNLDFNDPAKLVSQLLGYAIVAGSFTLKLPQVLNIVKAGSAAGLSELTTAIEVFGFLTSYLYGRAKGFPLETYAENGVISVQVVALFALLLVYNKKVTSLPHLLFVALMGAYVWAFATGRFADPIDLPALHDVPVVGKYAHMPLLEVFFMMLTPLGLLGKLPQILQFHRAKSTGQAALPTFFLQFAGSVARVFTTLTQVGDPIMLASFSVNAILGFVMLVQFWLYYGKKEKKA